MGDDEQECLNRTCQGLFRCQNSQRCLHFYDVKDGKTDCEDGEDEIFSELSSCPDNCRCLMNAMTCVNISLDDWRVENKNSSSTN